MAVQAIGSVSSLKAKKSLKKANNNVAVNTTAPLKKQATPLKKGLGLRLNRLA